jgi:diguanylate cyclase (GGDEF)-like protein
VTAQPEFARNSSAAHSAAEADDALTRLSDENALLRAALAELRARIGLLEESADADPLTGLPNERECRRQLERVVSQAERHGTPAALLTIDLRGLKTINDRYGRVAGDAALIHVARLLRGLVRTSDVAARFDGGFALILDHLDSGSAIETGERIVRFIAEQPLELGSAQIRIDATIGIASIFPGDSADGVLARARRNLERVKEF